MPSHDQFQGGLDGLCGLYSISNALRAIFPRLSVEILDQACQTAVRNMSSEVFQQLFLDGMDDSHLNYFMTSIQTELLNEGKIFEFAQFTATV